jgi:thioesterase domain-containing protein
MGDHRPRAGVETEMHRLWVQVLGRSDFGVDEDFFDVGGTSLLALRLVVEARRQLGFALPPSAVFEQPTVAGLALHLRGAATSEPTALVPIRPAGGRPPLYCVHPIGGSVACYLPLARALDEDQPVFGLQAVGLSGQGSAPDRVEALAAAYIGEIVEARGVRPFALVGYSFGGVVAFEMARQWRERFGTTPFLVLVDAPTDYSRLDPEVYPYLTVARTVLKIPFDPTAALGASRAQAVRALRDGAVAAGHFPPGTDLSLVDRIVDVVAANCRAVAAYQFGRLDGPAVLFRSTTDPQDGPDLGWGRVLPGLVVRPVGLDHYEIMETQGVPHVLADLAGDLRGLYDVRVEEEGWSGYSERMASAGSRTGR